MPKYLIQASYTAEGLKGVQKDKASGRKAVASKAVESVGGKLESFYCALGANEVVIIVDLPDNVSAAALSVTASAGGLIHSKTTALLTVEEVDKALAKSVSFKAPGRR
jgi:uncharacterized protein with GYD domain